LSEEICNEYAAQIIFCQSQAFPTEQKPDFQNKPKVLKTSQNFKMKSGFKSQNYSMATQPWPTAWH